MTVRVTRRTRWAVDLAPSWDLRDPRWGLVLHCYLAETRVHLMKDRGTIRELVFVMDFESAEGDLLKINWRDLNYAPQIQKHLRGIIAGM